MLLTVFGAPSPFSYWTVAALRSTVDACRSSHRFVETSSLSKLRETFAEDESVPLVYFCDCPEADLARTFLESGTPYLVCLEAPEEVLGFCLRERAMRPVDALRFTAQCFSALHDLALGPNAKVLCRQLSMSASQAVVDFCSTFRLTSDTTLAANAVRRLTGQPDFSDALVETLVQGVSANARPLGAYSGARGELGAPEWIVETARQFAPMLEGQPVDAAFWPRQAFLDPLGVDEAVALEQDLTRPARHLIFGPFLHLPAGKWRATVGFEVANARANALTVDVAIMGEAVQIGNIELPELGKFQFSLEFEVKEPKHFLEIRIALQRGAIEGKFRFGGVRLQRFAVSPPDVFA